MDKIYVYLIDGCKTLVPINAKEVGYCKFELLQDSEFDNLDSSELFEFYPGDIIQVEDTQDLDLEYQYVAKKLLSSSIEVNERKYLKFKFYSTQRLIPINEEIALEYEATIERIKKEKEKGFFFYKGILETMEILSKHYLNK